MMDEAARIIASAAADVGSGAGYDDAAEERHQRRMRAMRALGDIEQAQTRFLKSILLYGAALILAVILVFALAVVTQPELPRNPDSMTALCKAFAKWKDLSHQPGAAPRLTYRCEQGP